MGGWLAGARPSTAGRWWALGLLAWLLTAAAQDPGMWEEDAQRLRVGVRLFPAALGALLNLNQRTGDGGVLRVLVVHSGPAAPAEDAARALRGVGKVRGLPLVVSVLDAADLERDGPRPVAGVFVASVGIDGARLRDWSERLQALVFSPFAGDVERGAVAGVFVTDRVLPEVNLTQARRAGLRFKPFFLGVARQHE